jgi:Protein of unknown function (DUF4229)
MPASDRGFESEPDAAPGGGGAGRALLMYTLLRLVLFALSYLALWALFGTWVPWPAIALLALVITAVVSLLFLRRLSARAGVALFHLRQAGRDRLEAARAAEDVDDDEPGNRGQTKADA